MTALRLSALALRSVASAGRSPASSSGSRIAAGRWGITTTSRRRRRSSASVYRMLSLARSRRVRWVRTCPRLGVTDHRNERRARPRCISHRSPPPSLLFSSTSSPSSSDVPASPPGLPFVSTAVSASSVLLAQPPDPRSRLRPCNQMLSRCIIFFHLFRFISSLTMSTDTSTCTFNLCYRFAVMGISTVVRVHETHTYP